MEKHGLAATQDAFPVKKRTLYLWKAKWHKANGKLEVLNDISKVPKTKRTRVWDEKVIAEIKRLRWDHPNLGKDLIAHCEKNLWTFIKLICLIPIFLITRSLII